MSLPNEFRFLPEYSPTVTDQWEYSEEDEKWHSIDNCVAHALACLMSYIYMADTGENERFSYNWIYGNRKSSDYQGEGMYMEEALDQLIEDGVPLYSSLPKQNTYDTVIEDTFPAEDDTSVTIPELSTAKDAVNNNYSSLIDEAKKYKINDYFLINFSDIAVMKNKLLKTPLILDADSRDLDCEIMWSGGDNNDEDFIIQNHSDSEPVGQAWHTMLIIGWKRINYTTYWIVRNNWGYAWGQSGIAYLPMNYDGVRKVYFVSYFSYMQRFLWDNTKKSGETFSISAIEWNNLIDKIKQLETRAYGYNLTHFYVNKGDTFYASYFNQIKDTLDNLLSYFNLSITGIQDFKKDDICYADSFNILQDKINEIIYILN